MSGRYLYCQNTSCGVYLGCSGGDDCGICGWSAGRYMGDEDEQEDGDPCPDTGVNDSLEIIPEDVALSDGDELCRLTDAQALIAELRAEVDRWKSLAETSNSISEICLSSRERAEKLGLQAAPAERGVPEQALRDMMRGYVVLLELARDKIVGLGGHCDPVSVMEAQDPWLRDARKILESLNPAPATADSDVREVK